MPPRIRTRHRSDSGSVIAMNSAHRSMIAMSHDMSIEESLRHRLPSAVPLAGNQDDYRVFWLLNETRQRRGNVKLLSRKSFKRNSQGFTPKAQLHGTHRFSMTIKVTYLWARPYQAMAW
jgi:hypothetical protein